ncbi:phage tail tape measure protein [Halorubrum sp. AJ67]|uniref:phage tail tape measure protein n=1 Tax=Halorubrum sp. AJ67 TaxID=1173487 RepID=UPI0003DBEC38|nr:phage tail tape measure protein [Halorubrum sp. AJ67]CDK39681.1 phage tail tape measure protein, TP901 family [Halorubrum sp. AJ67]
MSFTPSGDQELAIEISAEDNASGAFGNVEGSALGMKEAVAGAGAVLAGAGVAGLAGAASAAADFESAMVEVEKVTNAETAEAMSGSVRELAETIPLAQKELAGIAADAGRFGVEGPKNIEKFTESTAKMASATDLNTQEAGQAFAKLTELTGTPISEVENLGSAINELSNNTATSAQEITDSMMRSSGALSSLGMSQTEIAGMSAAINEVSESSERAGTRMRRLGQEMVNPKKVGDLSSALGMTKSEFEEMREKSPDELMLQMAEAMKQGGDEADALKNALSTTSRQALTGLAQNIDGTREALEMSSTAYEENTSVQEEFEASADTFNKKLQTLKNRLRNVGIVMGNQILPILITAMERLGPLIDGFSEVNERMDGMPALIATLGVALTGLGAIAVTVGPAIVGALSPVLLPVAAIMAAVGALGYAWKSNFGGIRDTTQQAWSTLKPVLIGIRDTLVMVFEEYAMPVIQNLRAVAEEEFRAIEKQIVPTMDHIGNVVTDVLSFLGKFWDKHGERIMQIVETNFEFIELVVGTVMRAISSQIQIILALIRGDFDEVLKIVKDFWTTTFEDILGFIKGPWLKGIKASFGLLFDVVTGVFKKLYNVLIGNSIVPDTFNEILSFITGWISSAKKTFKQFLGSVFSIWKGGLTRVYNFYKDTFYKITDWIKNTGATLFGSAFGSILDTIVGVVDDIRTEINVIVDTIIAKIQDALDFITELNDFNFDIDWPEPPDIVEDAFNGDLDIDWPSAPNLGGGSSSSGSSSSSDDDGDDDEYDGGGSLGTPGPTWGLASGGIVTDAVNAVVGEGTESEAVLPLSKLSQHLDTAYEVGAETVSTGGVSRNPSSSSETSLAATLRVEGDNDLAELIRENAELVIEENETSKSNRIARM